MTGFAENVEMHDYTVQGIKQTLFTDNIIGNIPTQLRVGLRSI